jgi:AraC-like DNA-binding protein
VLRKILSKRATIFYAGVGDEYVARSQREARIPAVEKKTAFRFGNLFAREIQTSEKRNFFSRADVKAFESEREGRHIMNTIQKNENSIYDGEKLQFRLDYARYLLTQTFEPVSEIAAACGWKNENDFTVVFQNLVGVSPVHYRRWHQI